MRSRPMAVTLRRAAAVSPESARTGAAAARRMAAPAPVAQHHLGVLAPSVLPNWSKVTVGPTKSRGVFLPRRSAYVRRPRLARVNDASEKKIATVDPRRTRRTRAPRGHHHPSTAYCPVDGVFKRISGGRGRRTPPPPRGRLRLPRALPPLPLRQDAYSTTASPEAASEGSSRRGDFTLFFEPMRARRQPDRGPTQKSRRRHARDAGPNAPETRGRPRRTRRGKSWTRRRPRPAAARGRQGAHGRAGHREGARHECGLRPPRSHHGRAGFTG